MTRGVAATAHALEPVRCRCAVLREAALAVAHRPFGATRSGEKQRGCLPGTTS